MNDLLNWLADEADDGESIDFDNIYEFARRQLRSESSNRQALAYVRWYDQRWPIPDDRMEDIDA